MEGWLSHATTPIAPPRLLRSNYRACVRAHKMALNAQRTFWAALLHDTIMFKSLQKSFAVMNTVGRGLADHLGERLGTCDT